MRNTQKYWWSDHDLDLESKLIGFQTSLPSIFYECPESEFYMMGPSYCAKNIRRPSNNKYGNSNAFLLIFWRHYTYHQRLIEKAPHKVTLNIIWQKAESQPVAKKTPQHQTFGQDGFLSFFFLFSMFACSAVGVVVSAAGGRQPLREREAGPRSLPQNQLSHHHAA